MEQTVLPTPEVMYAALSSRDRSFEGIFIAAIRTTGIFCRPGCPARTPRLENVIFYPTTGNALAAGYRPCKRCLPMAPLGEAPDWLGPLLAQVERERSRRWRDRDLVGLGLEPRRVRRWFLTNHGMTFHAYQRARRLGLALGALQEGGDVTGCALDAGFASESGFREAFGQLFALTPGAGRSASLIEISRVITPLGPMVAGLLIEDVKEEGKRQSVALLEFTDRRALERQLEELGRRTGAVFAPAAGKRPLFDELCAQLDEYFRGERKDFDLPLALPGSPFQLEVWRALSEIPSGETQSYGELAEKIGHPGASRAVGRANGQNRLAILVPCHRVIRSDGSLSGYGGGLWRKQALLDLEQK